MLANSVRNNAHICPLCMNEWFHLWRRTSQAFNKLFKSGFMKTEYPKPGDHVRFERKLKTVPRVIIGFADFESSLRPISREENGEKYNYHYCHNSAPISECKHSTSDIHAQIQTHSTDDNLLNHCLDR